MGTTDTYYYRKGKVASKAVAYAVTTAVLVAGAWAAHARWDLSFLVTDWKGFVIMGVYGLFSLGMALSAVEAFGKWHKLRQGIPALTIEPDGIVVYDTKGLPTRIAFDDCEKVRVKHDYTYRQGPILLTLVLRHSGQPAEASQRTEVKLYEFSTPQRIVEKAFWKAYNTHKKLKES